MTITALDPKTALVLIDLQKGIISFPTAHPIDGVIKNASALAAAFRARGLPVVLVNVTGGAPGRTDSPRFSGPFPDGWAELVPELDQQPSDIVITKLTWGAFHATELEDRLKALGVTQIVLGGVSTSIGVETTARQAYERGLNVTLATDAMTDMAQEAHENSLTRIFPRLGESGSTQDIIAKLSQAVA
jgi:nicotinamidase-related amidase